jgi:uncharacterized protein YkwD
MRLLNSFLTLFCVTSLCLTGCGSNGDGSSEPDGGTPDGGTADSPFAREMISAHNSVRISATPAPNPPLSPLTWSNTAASKAQAWADQCKFTHNPNLGNYGENLAAAAPPNTTATAGVVQDWAAESASYDYGLNTCASGHVCGHYTQLVWRDTTQVGCATKVCSTNSPFGGFPQWQIWVCDYSPPGNFAGQRPY